MELTGLALNLRVLVRRLGPLHTGQQLERPRDVKAGSRTDYERALCARPESHLHRALLSRPRERRLPYGEWRCVIGLVLVFFAFVTKIGQEEQLMMQTFPEAILPTASA